MKWEASTTQLPLRVGAGKKNPLIRANEGQRRLGGRDGWGGPKRLWVLWTPLSGGGEPRTALFCALMRLLELDQGRFEIGALAFEVADLGDDLIRM